MIVIKIEVEGKDTYHPGTAIVRVNGEIHAKLRTGESFELTVKDPEFSTQMTYPPRESQADAQA